ncbi:hypothetical protein DP923_01440 [Pontibacter arcticus]|uniref:Uncharacterized protein n=1 Tax=Pontibacter arcticus TaxID=2080288 RepID=A0A364RHH8_9BACT|nr:hypothetical protein DP923_01440 [Pontibacter arcticus]
MIPDMLRSYFENKNSPGYIRRYKKWDVVHVLVAVAAPKKPVQMAQRWLVAAKATAVAAREAVIV